jgi:uncharacterized repeat protein (TIGR02543 family)
MLYTFPVPKAGDLWEISDYDLFEIFLKITDGSVDVCAKVANGGNPNTDLFPYPSGNRYPTFSSTVNNGEFSYLAVIEEGENGIAFQRMRGGPVTVAIDKVVYTKGTRFTITFSGGDYTAMPPIESLKVLKDKTVSSSLIQRPRRPGFTFAGWFTAGNVEFNTTTAITADMALTAHWTEGEPEATDMKLNLNKASWGTLPPHPNVDNPNAMQSGGWSHPTNYAESAYNSTTSTLTLTFDGNNRQRAIIPLSNEQVQELIWTPETSVTFKIVGTVKNEDGTDSEAMFRCHLGDPSTGSNWNGTDTIDSYYDAPFNESLVKTITFSGNKSAATLKWFIIQAMYGGNPSQPVQSGFPKVIMNFTSIAIEPGNTQ